MVASDTPSQDDLAELVPGYVVGGRYRLEAPLGSGGMGSVWRATHESLGHAVAVKFLHRAGNQQQRARFDREARIAAQLGDANRHVARVIEHGLTPSGSPWLVMELLHGEGFDRRLARDRRLSLGVTARIVNQLCKALDVAHERGIVHRDLKPANIFLVAERDGEVSVKLIDFGIAKALLERDEAETTHAGALLGTPVYMSPEQIKAEKSVDVRTDLWAVAAIAYRAVCGVPPFGSGSLEELGLRILCIEPKKPSELVPELGPDFDAWIEKGLAKNPDNRFKSAQELAETLSNVAGTSVNSTGPIPTLHWESILPAAPGAKSDGEQHETAHPITAAVRAVPLRKRRGVPIAIGGLLLAAAAGGVILMRTNKHEDPRGPAATASVSQPPSSGTAKTNSVASAAPTTVDSTTTTAPTIASSTTASPKPSAVVPTVAKKTGEAKVDPKTKTTTVEAAPSGLPPEKKKTWDDPSQM